MNSIFYEFINSQLKSWREIKYGTEIYHSKIKKT
jgi:hypothetical protein